MSTTPKAFPVIFMNWGVLLGVVGGDLAGAGMESEASRRGVLGSGNCTSHFLTSGVLLGGVGEWAPRDFSGAVIPAGTQQLDPPGVVGMYHKSP